MQVQVLKLKYKYKYKYWVQVQVHKLKYKYFSCNSKAKVAHYQTSLITDQFVIVVKIVKKTCIYICFLDPTKNSLGNKYLVTSTSRSSSVASTSTSAKYHKYVNMQNLLTVNTIFYLVTSKHNVNSHWCHLVTDGLTWSNLCMHSIDVLIAGYPYAKPTSSYTFDLIAKIHWPKYSP